MSVCAILLAAGSGRRMQTEGNKILLPLGGKTVLEHSLDAIRSCGRVDSVILVIRPEDEAQIRALIAGERLPIRLVYGGEERRDSVRNALKALDAETETVAIHDAARCLAGAELFSRCIDSAERLGSGIAGRRVYDTVKRVDGDRIIETLDRSELVLIETPQCFRRGLICRAYEAAERDGFFGTDDAMLLERLGERPVWVLSEETNIKMTDPRDMEYARFLRQGRTALRTGMGYDAHRLEVGRKLVLGGAEIPSERGLLGHSDADVLTHAVMDALLGAAALGDIGGHFPDTDPKYRGISSILLLKEVGGLLRAAGAEVVNLDATLVLQAPKIAPYREAMRKNIAEALEIPLGSVSVKATTTEKMGFEGRGEGASAMAIATVRMPCE